MSKRYFDVIVIVPLEEEYEVALSHFNSPENLSSTQQIRFAVSAPNSELTVLLVKQNGMGKTHCQNAATWALAEFAAGGLVCVGIAGGLTSDLHIGDICYTGSVADLLDNAKIATGSASNLEISFSPTHYETPIGLIIALNLDRLKPETKTAFEAWRSEREAFAKKQIPSEYIGRDKLKESIDKPNVKDGILACAAVSDSPKYNEKIKGTDRKILAVETESGGLFSVATLHNLPALTIRGISDYAGAGIDKNQFEKETNNKARLVAASNAVSFLAYQLANELVKEFFVAQRSKATGQTVTLETSTDVLARTLKQQGDQFEVKLKDLAPSYALISKGYKLPVPRVRISANPLGGGTNGASEPMEIRDAIRNSRVLNRPDTFAISRPFARVEHRKRFPSRRNRRQAVFTDRDRGQRD